MANSLFIAKIIGSCYIIFALGMIFNRRFYLILMEDFARNKALVFYAGFLALFIGFLIVFSHNLWVRDWRVLVTIFGWAGIIKGAWLVILPQTLGRYMEEYSKHKYMFTFHTVLALVLGLVFAYFGFIV